MMDDVHTEKQVPVLEIKDTGRLFPGLLGNQINWSKYLKTGFWKEKEITK